MHCVRDEISAAAATSELMSAEAPDCCPSESSSTLLQSSSISKYSKQFCSAAAQQLHASPDVTIASPNAMTATLYRFARLQIRPVNVSLPWEHCSTVMLIVIFAHLNICTKILA